MPEPTIAHRRYQCRHIFTDGHRCGSPALRLQDFCYYHHAHRPPVVRSQPANPHHDTYNYPPNQTAFTLPLPEDRSAVQLSLGQIMNGLANNTLDPRRAGLLLYALQIASQNLKNAPVLNPDHIVQDVIHDPAVGPLAPHNELPSDKNHREILEYLNNLEGDEEDEEDEDFDDEEDQEDEDSDDEDEDFDGEDTDADRDDEEVDDEDEDTEKKEESKDDETVTLNANAGSPGRLSLTRYPKRRSGPKSSNGRTLPISTPRGRYPVPRHTTACPNRVASRCRRVLTGNITVRRSKWQLRQGKGSTG